LTVSTRCCSRFACDSARNWPAEMISADGGRQRVGQAREAGCGWSQIPALVKSVQVCGTYNYKGVSEYLVALES